ncbi:hypothetical protein [Nocardia callitridis]|uniref:hypothetical protein n=1 Tax=Nocardia callitridis TaxID=648753 RepID=UPI0031E66546
MTTADLLEARGRAEVLLELLTLKFGPLPTEVIAAVRIGSIEQLRVWTADILTADRLDQFFS